MIDTEQVTKYNLMNKDFSELERRLKGLADLAGLDDVAETEVETDLTEDDSFVGDAELRLNCFTQHVEIAADKAKQSLKARLLHCAIYDMRLWGGKEQNNLLIERDIREMQI